MTLLHVRDSLMKEILEVIPVCPGVDETEGKIARLIGARLHWCRWQLASAQAHFEDPIYWGGPTALKRRLPDPSIAAAKQRAHEMIFTCLLVRRRLKADLPIEVWKLIFCYVNRAEHAL